jgi:branched-chain amino acid transport system substrate-binding protein
MTQRSFVRNLGIVLASLLATNVNAQTDGVFRDKIVVHHVGPFTNSALAASNKETLDAADLYLSLVNARGGVNGRKIIIERNDDSQDSKKTSEITQAIVKDRGALALLLPRTSPSTEAMMPLAESAGLPLIGPQPGPTTVTSPMKRYVFAVRASYHAEVERAIELQHTLGRRTFAFLIAADAFGSDVIKGAEAKLATYNLKPIVIEKIDNRNPEVSKAIAVFAKAKPEVIIFAAGAKAHADFIKGYAPTGNFTQFIALSNSSNSQFLKELGDFKRGVIVMQVFPSPDAATSELTREYREAVLAAKKTISYASFQGFITAKILVEAITRAGKTPTPASVTAALESMRNFDLGGYVITFGQQNRMGSKFVEPTMITKDGRFI